MAWGVIESAGRTQSNTGQQSSLAPYASQAFLRDALCPSCHYDAAEFMLSSEQAIQQAGLKPDDQIWLQVFASLQRMLAQRSACSVCKPKRSDSARLDP